MKSAELWNNATDSNGNATVDLPLVDVKVASRDIVTVMPQGMVGPGVPIRAGTRVKILPNTPWINGKVEIIDGPDTGVIHEILAADMASFTDERS